MRQIITMNICSHKTYPLSNATSSSVSESAKLLSSGDSIDQAIGFVCGYYRSIVYLDVK